MVLGWDWAMLLVALVTLTATVTGMEMQTAMGMGKETEMGKALRFLRDCRPAEKIVRQL